MVISFFMIGSGREITGGQVVIYNYANYLAKQGNKVRIYAWLDKSVEKYIIPKFLQGIFCTFLTKRYPRWFTFHKNVDHIGVMSADEIQDGDVVIATAVRTAEAVKRLPNSKGKKVYFIQDHENWTQTDEFVNKTYSFGMKNITVAKWLSNIVDQYSLEPSICIRNGIDGALFNNRRMVRDKHSIVFQYRTERYKGCDIAIKAIEQLHEKYLDLKISLITNGDIPKVPDYVRVYRKIKQSKVAQINNLSEVFLCTSREEGYGLPGLEAMACGCALVSTAYKGVLEYAEDNRNALLIPIDDVNAVVKAVTKLFEDSELRTRIVDEGLKTAQDFTLEKAAQKFESVIKVL